MILELHVKNFALINDARIEFGEGFNVLTGETGAGKSLLIDALLVIAGRGGTEFIRTGCEEAILEATFATSDELKASYEEIGDEDFISLRKVLLKSGKSKQYINGNFVSQSRIKEVFGRLLHVYGQSETKDLYEEAYQRELFDLFCDNKELLRNLKDAVLEARQKKKALNDILEKEATRLKEMDFLEYQINEIKSANLQDDMEEEHLKEARIRLQSREKILTNLGNVYELLYAGESNAFDLLSQSNRMVGELKLDENFFTETIEEIKQISENIKNRAIQIKAYIEELEGSDEDINKIEERLDVIYRLKKKYGNSIREIKTVAEDLEKRLEVLKNIEISKAKTEEELQKSREKVIHFAGALSKKRQALTDNFGESVQKELTELGMPKCVFRIELNQVDFTNPEDMPLTGKETVNFYFSSHSGEEAKPLNKIASGGELSRVMLAVKNIIPRERSMTVIFDEVDTGVGGKTAEMLGKKLKEISRHHQVLCITHLPQVAVFGEHHFKVEKTEKRGKLDIAIKRLNDSERVMEITRMLGGDRESKGMEYAEELLKKAIVSGGQKTC